MQLNIRDLLASLLHSEWRDAREAAKALSVPEISLRRIIEGREPMSAEVAVKLEIAGFMTAESWLTTQLHEQIAKAREELNS